VKNILIVDNDLPFVFWLCQVLGAAGYETVPATGVPEAVAAMAELDIRVDLLMVRRALPGADAFAAELRSTQRGRLKAIALIGQNETQSDSIAGWDGWQIKLKVSDAIARKIFLSLVQSALTDGTAESW
jgi:CheY-like chemotaxis protein